ncbi:retrovirus-related pol polyprotein from transposon TNT 1-94, partial [Tanacetum coccineum]
KPAKPSTPDRDWNKTLPDAHGPVQPWLSSLVQMEDLRESFNELMDTSLDFSTFVMNRLKVDTLTPELLADLTFELMKGSCKSLLEIVDWHNYKHLDWITVHMDDVKLYKFKECDFNRLRIQDIEDMPLLLVQGKLTNLTVEERLAFSDAVNSLLYEADAHLKDPVYGCAGIISSLLQEIELAQTKAEIALVGAAQLVDPFIYNKQN